MKTTIEICGEINQSTLAYVFTALENPSDEIDIFVDSDGGIIGPALDMYVAILAHPARKTAYIRNASSAALFPALAADRRIALPGARILLHRSAYVPPASERWTADRHAEVAAQLRERDGEMAAVLAYRTDRPAATFIAEMESETDAPLDWCIEHNIITGIST